MPVRGYSLWGLAWGKRELILGISRFPEYTPPEVGNWNPAYTGPGGGQNVLLRACARCTWRAGRVHDGAGCWPGLGRYTLKMALGTLEVLYTLIHNGISKALCCIIYQKVSLRTLCRQSATEFEAIWDHLRPLLSVMPNSGCPRWAFLEKCHFSGNDINVTSGHFSGNSHPNGSESHIMARIWHKCNLRKEHIQAISSKKPI